ncbi:MAG: transporter substrate-binding domain-containing protein [Legionellales bacterium]|nr:transporter substrate-binding domain-containing protein [Legionellales bacterium]
MFVQLLKGASMKIKQWLIVISVCLWWMSPLFAAQKVTLVTADWEPYVQDEEGYRGYVYEIVRAAFKQAGYQSVIEFLPWQQALQAIEQGQADAIFPKYLPIEPEAHLMYSQSFAGGPIVIYKRKDSSATFDYVKAVTQQDNPFTALQAYTIGVVEGYRYLPAFDQATQLTKRKVKDDRDNLHQLFQGQVDFIVIDQHTAIYLLENVLPEDYAQQLEFILPALAYQQLHIAFNKNNPQTKALLEAFNKGLTIIQQNGVLDQIIDRDAQFTGGQVV